MFGWDSAEAFVRRGGFTDLLPEAGRDRHSTAQWPRIELGGDGIGPEVYDWEFPPTKDHLTDTVWQVDNVAVLRSAAQHDREDRVSPVRDLRVARIRFPQCAA